NSVYLIFCYINMSQHKSIPWLVSLGAAIAGYCLLPGAWYVLIGSLAGLVVAFVMAQYD
ncbi:hypothetical protein SASC598O02_000260, partial [Snodgrassella alvi SCGC AB-598-O02]